MLAGKEAKQPQHFLMHFPHSHRSSYFTVWIAGQKKLVKHYLKKDEERYEYFDLALDPYEETNRHSKGEEILDDLHTAMDEELAKVGAQMPKIKEGK